MTELNSEGLEKAHDPKLVEALSRLVKRLEATPEPLRGPFLVQGLKPYLSALPPVDEPKKEHSAVTKAREISKKLASDPFFNSFKPTPVTEQDVMGHLTMARALIQEAKGAEGPEWGYVTAHLDAAEYWLDKVEGTLYQAPSAIAGVQAEIADLRDEWQAEYDARLAANTARRAAEARISSLEEENKRLRTALKPFAKAADGRKSKGYGGGILFRQDALLTARHALEDHNDA